MQGALNTRHASHVDLATSTFPFLLFFGFAPLTLLCPDRFLPCTLGLHLAEVGVCKACSAGGVEWSGVGVVALPSVVLLCLVLHLGDVMCGVLHFFVSLVAAEE